MEEKQSRISANFAIIMVVFALCIDLAQVFLDFILIGLILNPVIDIGVLFGFWMIFRMRGVSFTGTRAFVFFGLGLLNFFPGASEFALWTADVIAVIVMVAAEDRIPALKELDQTGLAKKNPAALKAMMNPKQIQDLKGVSGGIMNKLQATRNMPKPVMSRGAARERQKYDTELDRGSKIAAQRNQKQNANQNENQVAV